MYRLTLLKAAVHCNTECIRTGKGGKCIPREHFASAKQPSDISDNAAVYDGSLSAAKIASSRRMSYNGAVTEMKEQITLSLS